MGTVGISFGSATSGTGFDVTSTVNNIVSNLQAVETPWKNQLTSLKSQDTAFTSLGTDLSTLSTNLQALTDFQGVMSSKLGSSSDTNVLSLNSASPTAVAGSHTIVVRQLAQTSTAYSAVVSSSDTLTGGLTFQVGASGTPHTIPVVSGSSDTPSTYAAAINAAGIGVTARVITDTTGSRLSFISGIDGAAGQLRITSGGDGTTALTDISEAAPATVAIKLGLTGQDALLNVDGVDFESASNSVSAAISGVTFQLLSANPDSQVQVQIVNDTGSVKNAFSSFITAYNTIVNDLKTQEGKDSSGNAEPLYGSPVLSQIQSGLSLALTSGVTSGSISSLYQLGISINQDGTLALDSTMLDSALNSNFSDVVGYLQNADSFGMKLQSALSEVGNESSTGAISLALEANANQEATLNTNVSAQDALIDAQKSKLTSELTLANETLQAIPQQLDEVNQLYSAITGYNTRS